MYLLEFESSIEESDDRRLVRGLLKCLLRIRARPILIITFGGEVDVHAVRPGVSEIRVTVSGPKNDASKNGLLFIFHAARSPEREAQRSV